jgi:hypothetical protein
MAYDAPTSNDQELDQFVLLPSGFVLARVVELEEAGARARVRVGERECWAAIDPSVDPLLLEQARERGVRVVVEGGAQPVVVGLLMTARTLEIDRHGRLEATVKKFTLLAEEALIQTPHAFLRLRREVAEVFSEELVLRGRTIARILGKMIKLN